MKKFITHTAFFTLLVTGLSFTSCSTEEDPVTPVSEIPEHELNGKLESDRTLDPTVVYQLTGAFEVMSGATLNIPAGTKIVASQGTDVYIAIHQNADINISGTAEAPVLMTTENQNPGDWGGLLIMGNAVTTAGSNAVAEVGGFTYGGTVAEDNSGSIQYLILEGAGAQINADSQYNGLSLYAVGSGTLIQNIAIRNGADDGVEFFGGSVSVTNLYLQNNEDDAVDWTEGWNGTVTNTYAEHSITGFSTAVEADGLNNQPNLVNFTAISTTGGTALQFKKESGANITNLYLEGYTTNIDMRDGGSLSNVMIEGNAATTDTPYQGTKVDISGWTWISQ